MLKLDIEHLLKLRAIKHPTTYLMTHGFTEHEARGLIDPDKKMIQLEMLTRLCVLFDCTINELFTWNGKEDHPLAALKRTQVKQITQLLEKKRPSELEELYKKLENGEL